MAQDSGAKVKKRTALVNQTRALLMEQGLIIPQGITHVRKFLPSIIEDLENGLSFRARDYLSELYANLWTCDAAVAKYEARISEFAKSDSACRRLQKNPGVDPLTATAIVAHILRYPAQIGSFIRDRFHKGQKRNLYCP